MFNAGEYIKDRMKSIDIDNDYPIWKFCNQVLMATSPSSEINSVQMNVLEATLQEVICHMHDEFLSDKLESQRWAMQIGTWINVAHLANRT